MPFSFLKAETVLWSTAGLFVFLFVITVGVQFFDKRWIFGESVWAKPLKFDIALAIHFATLAIVVGALSEPYRSSSLLLAVALAAFVSAGFEITYMVVQAARQQASHFNLSTPLYAAMYALMALGAVVITGAAGIVGVAAWLHSAARLSNTLRTAVAIGLIGGTVLTLIVAFRMGAALNHHVGVESAGAARVPIVGWSRTVGDLRVPHFFATHMMQAVPIAGLVIERIASGAVAISLVWLFAAIWSSLTWFLFSRALAGQPFVGPAAIP